MTKMRMELPTEKHMFIMNEDVWEEADRQRDCANVIFIILSVANALGFLLTVSALDNTWGAVAIHALISVFIGIGLSKIMKDAIPYYAMVSAGVAMTIASLGAYVVSTV